jgi:hypothetical protein
VGGRAMIAAIYARKSNAQDVADEQESVARQIDHVNGRVDRLQKSGRILYNLSAVTGSP